MKFEVNKKNIYILSKIGLNFQPNKDNFHPIDDACWTKGQPVPYTVLAQTFYTMEQTTKRIIIVFFLLLLQF